MNKNIAPSGEKKGSLKPHERLAKLEVKGLGQAEIDMRLLAFEAPKGEEAIRARQAELQGLQKALQGKTEYKNDGTLDEAAYVMRTSLQFMKADKKKQEKMLEDLAMNPEDLMHFLNEHQASPWGKQILDAAEAIQRERFPEDAKKMRELMDKKDEAFMREARAKLQNIKIS